MDTKELKTMMMVNMDNNPYHHNHHHDYEHDDQTSSLGFMELLAYDQDYDSYNPSTMFDEMTTSYQQLPPSSSSMEMIISTSADDHNHVNLDYNHMMMKEEEFTTLDEVEEETSSVVLNGHYPSSPNCSSIISSPDHHQRLHHPVEHIKEKETVGGDDDIKIKIKKKKKDKEKEPRFAFMTRTEIDHLDDGYRWRKYGQKAVKNSHFPRSYYRCTTASCNVKKRVERSMGDSSYVITTYEGKHNHPVARNSTPLIPSFNHLITTTTTASAAYASAPPAILKQEQAGLLQDMLHCHY